LAVKELSIINLNILVLNKKNRAVKSGPLNCLRNGRHIYKKRRSNEKVDIIIIN
jgi:hypothetical protein